MSEYFAPAVLAAMLLFPAAIPDTRHVTISPGSAAPGGTVQVATSSCSSAAPSVTATSSAFAAYTTLTRSGSGWHGTAKLSPYSASGLKTVYVYCAGGPFTGEFTVGAAGSRGAGRVPWLLGAVLALGGVVAVVVRRRRRT
ncbi:hypothetical protein GCM10009555_092860 [Acrocarpospora macrocephala]|uniref:Uncharacterized protein n=1 Tax=Acrocarpospora macrocephala TaxID=150177 RepID=A0A5M3X347_9ACTN|nr:hypothetical protein [Acrocarpospora macrocephala]GES16155.1 hypothetical protein Amac_097530 [Acrocarpospora macrocephala]